MIPPVLSREMMGWRDGRGVALHRDLAEEIAVALVFDGATEAVMMATPSDLEDFALGFGLAEGLIGSLDDIVRMEIVPGDLGVEVRLWLRSERGQAVARRRRQRIGPVGCGLCGVDSLEAALRSPSPVRSELYLTPDEIIRAVTDLPAAQILGARTRAIHAAGLWRPGEGFAAVREDVGRHNALDKLAGVAASKALEASGCAVVLTSRVSVDLVQKVAMMGAPVLIAMSAPTAHALRMAEAANLTIVAIARADGFEVFTHPKRVVAAASP